MGAREVVEVAGGEPPVESGRGGVVEPLEGGEPGLDCARGQRLRNQPPAVPPRCPVVIVVLVNMNEGGRAVMMDGGPCDLRCCMGDGGWLALQSRLAEEGSKPPRGALAEDRGLERRWNRRDMIASGVDREDERWTRVLC